MEGNLILTLEEVGGVGQGRKYEGWRQEEYQSSRIQITEEWLIKININYIFPISSPSNKYLEFILIKTPCTSLPSMAVAAGVRRATGNTRCVASWNRHGCMVLGWPLRPGLLPQDLTLFYCGRCLQLESPFIFIPKHINQYTTLY